MALGQGRHGGQSVALTGAPQGVAVEIGPAEEVALGVGADQAVGVRAQAGQWAPRTRAQQEVAARAGVDGTRAPGHEM